MKKPLSKKAKGLLIALVVLAILGVCIVCVSSYAKKLMNEPKFVVPEAEPLASATSIPETEEEKLLYVEKLFIGSFGRGNNISKRTEISINDDSIVSNAKAPDLAIIKFAKGQILSTVSDSYEAFDKLEGNEVSAPDFNVNGGIVSCNFEQGRTEDNGEVKDENLYFFDFALSPEASRISTAFNLSADERYLAFLSDSFSEMLEISAVNAELTACNVNGNADRIYDQLRHIEFSRTYLVDAELQFIGEYSSLGKISIKFEVTASDKYDFSWYGARFSEKALYMNPEDEKTLPASVSVAENTEQSEFKLSFASADESIVSVSNDGIITAIKASDKPVEITMKLEYKGFTFTDICLVTVTELEVKS